MILCLKVLCKYRSVVKIFLMTVLTKKIIKELYQPVGPKLVS